MPQADNRQPQPLHYTAATLHRQTLHSTPLHSTPLHSTLVVPLEMLAQGTLFLIENENADANKLRGPLGRLSLPPSVNKALSRRVPFTRRGLCTGAISGHGSWKKGPEIHRKFIEGFQKL